MKIGRLLSALIFILFFTTDSIAQYNFDKFIVQAEEDIADSNFTEAIKKLNICIQIAPKNYVVYFYRGICEYSLYDDIGAERDFTMALSGYSQVFYNSYYNRSLVRYRMGNYRGSISDISKVIEKDPGNPALYISRGFSLLAINDFHGAIEDCNKALKLKWIGSNPYLCRAAAEDALADYENALCDYDEAIKINPGNAEFYVRRGMTKFKMEHIKDAINDYKFALKFDSVNTFAFYNLAEAEVKLGNNKMALAYYDTVLFYEPRNTYAYFNRAVLFSNMKRQKEAIDDFGKVLTLNPNNIQAYFNRAKVKQSIKDYKGAIDDYNKVIELYPYFMEAYYNRAQIKYSMNDIKGADKDIETGQLMSEMLHSKSNIELSRDSVLLTNLSRLNSDFRNRIDSNADTMDVGFLPLFYIAESDSINEKHLLFSTMLAQLNISGKQSFYFSNHRDNVSYNSDNAIAPVDREKEMFGKGPNEILATAIRKTNMMLLNEAKGYYNELLTTDANNPLTWFSRAVNTCREIEMMSRSNEPYILANSNQTIVMNELNEKCKSALADFSKAIILNPKFSFAYYDRANVKCILQDFEGALKDYETARKIRPDFAHAFYNEGILLYYLNHSEQSCYAFSKAGELGLSESYSMMKRICFK